MELRNLTIEETKQIKTQVYINTFFDAGTEKDALWLKAYLENLGVETRYEKGESPFYNGEIIDFLAKGIISLFHAQEIVAYFQKAGLYSIRITYDIEDGFFLEENE